MDKKILLGTNLFTNGEVIKDVAIAVEGNIIMKVGIKTDMQEDIKNADDILDFSDCTLLPGLIDCHMHLGPELGTEQGKNSPTYARIMEPANQKLIKAIVDVKNLLRAGFTSARNCGSRRALDIKECINDGYIEGPRLHCAGRGLQCSGGSQDHPYIKLEWVDELTDIATFCNGVDECIRAVREQVRLGADFIKLFPTAGETTQLYSDEEILAVMDEAKRRKMNVAIHCVGGPSLKLCVLNGVHTVEHGTFLTEEDLYLMAEHGTILIPTLGLPRKFAEFGPKYGSTQQEINRFKSRVAQMSELTNKAHKIGVKIAVGNDYGAREFTRHGAFNMYDLYQLYDAGLTEIEVLKAATINGAEVIGMDNKIGKVEQGYLADIIAVKGNPVENIQDMENVVFVMKDGQIIRKDK